ncbi:MAG: hypothetical protein WC325_13190 [Candidatus Bathyarchaeia archaeon]|jgi:hypothetical protein
MQQVNSKTESQTLNTEKYEKYLSKQYPELDKKQVAIIVEKLVSLAEICVNSYLDKNNGSKRNLGVIDNQNTETEDEENR